VGEAILASLIANTICWAALIGLGLLVWAYVGGRTLRRASQFFGTDRESRIVIFVSAHADERTITQSVITSEELEGALEFNLALLGQLQRIGWLSRLLLTLAQFSRAELRLPAISVRPSPLDTPSTYPDARSIILVGGPVRNQFVRFHEQRNSPWLVFNEADLRFQIARSDRAGEQLRPSDNLAIITRSRVEGGTVIVAAGFGEMHTRAALRYLARNWQTLNATHGANDFGIALRVSSTGEANPVVELP
jgi:hypothetical protein